MQTAQRGIQKFQHLAANATTPEERERYANAVKQLQTELIPKFEKEAKQLGRQLGLSLDQIGKTIRPEDLKGPPPVVRKQQKWTVVFHY